MGMEFWGRVQSEVGYMGGFGLKNKKEASFYKQVRKGLDIHGDISHLNMELGLLLFPVCSWAWNGAEAVVCSHLIQALGRKVITWQN